MSLKSVLVEPTLEGECSEPAYTNPGDTKTMKFKLGVVLVCAAILLPAVAAVQVPVPVGRWEIVHTSGDSSAQTDMYPGGFSTFLRADGTGDTYGTAANSLCVIDDNSSNVVPTWVDKGGNIFQITIAVYNLGAAPDVTFVYTGTYDALTPIPGDTSVKIPAITGTYYVVGDLTSACSIATQSSPGNFIATFLPTLSSGSSTGTLDGLSTNGGTAFDLPVDATITFSAPPVDGQIAGTVSLATNPTFNSGTPCFAAPGGVVTPLTIDPNQSTQSGILETIYAVGQDPQGVPTTLVLNGFSANTYSPGNGNPYADQITSTEWAVAAAIGEDDPTVAGAAGVMNDGTNNVMVQFYDVIGGACNNAGGADAPFHFLSGTPVVHGHRKHHHKSAPRKHDEPVRGRARR